MNDLQLRFSPAGIIVSRAGLAAENLAFQWSADCIIGTVARLP